MVKDNIIEQLHKRFEKQNYFSRQELYAFYTEFKPELKETTFRWIIYKLKKSQIITPVSKSLFTFSFKPFFKPTPNESEKKIYNIITKEFASLKFCIWSTRIVSEFMLHVPIKHIVIIQAEKEALEPMYDFLKTQKLGDIFIQPEDKEIKHYVFESNKSIILLPLVSKSPMQNINNIETITIEKLIVDLFSDKKIFIAYQGIELAHIIHTAFNRYTIDFTTLFHYAKRRRKDIDLKNFLIEKTDIPKEILND